MKPTVLSQIRIGDDLDSAPPLHPLRSADGRLINVTGSKGAFVAGGPVLGGMQLKKVQPVDGTITADQLVGGYIGFTDNAGASPLISLPSAKDIFVYLSREHFKAAGDPSAELAGSTLADPSTTVQTFECTFSTGTGNAPTLLLDGLTYYPNGLGGAPGAFVLEAEAVQTFRFFPVDFSDVSTASIAILPLSTTSGGIGGGGGGGPTTSNWATVLANGEQSGGKSPTITDGDQIIYQTGIRIGLANVPAGATFGTGMSFGAGASAGFDESIALGNNVTTTANRQIKLGKNDATVDIGGKLQMRPLDTANGVNFLVLPTFAGVPAAAPIPPPTGSMMIDTAANKLYFFSGGVWNTSLASGNTWNDSLLAGPLALVNPEINNGVEILFKGGLSISGNNTPVLGNSNENIAIGGAANAAGGLYNTAIGFLADATAVAGGACAIGEGAKATGFRALGLGPGSWASQTNSVAIGNGSLAGFQRSVAIGLSAIAGADDEIRLGSDVATTVSNRLKMRPMGGPTGDNVFYLGTLAGAPADNGQADGAMVLDTVSSRIWFRSGGVWTTGVGTGNTLETVLSNGNVSGNYDIRMSDGYGIRFLGSAQIGVNNALPASILTTTGMAFGPATEVEGQNPIAIGSSAVARSFLSPLALGVGANCTHDFSSAIGAGATTFRNNQIVLGSATSHAFCPSFMETGKISHLLLAQVNVGFNADGIATPMTFNNLESIDYLLGFETPYAILPHQTNASRFNLMNDKLYHFEFNCTFEYQGELSFTGNIANLFFVLIKDAGQPAAGGNISLILVKSFPTNAFREQVTVSGSIHYRVPAFVSAPDPAFQVQMQSPLLGDDALPHPTFPSRLWIRRLDAL